MSSVDIRPVIHNVMDAIERRLGETKMIHEIPTLKDYLKRWQDADIRDSVFLEALNKAYDDMASDRGFKALDRDTGVFVTLKFTNE